MRWTGPRPDEEDAPPGDLCRQAGSPPVQKARAHGVNHGVDPPGVEASRVAAHPSPAAASLKKPVEAQAAPHIHVHTRERQAALRHAVCRGWRHSRRVDTRQDPSRLWPMCQGRAPGAAPAASGLRAATGEHSAAHRAGAPRAGARQVGARQTGAGLGDDPAMRRAFHPRHLRASSVCGESVQRDQTWLRMATPRATYSNGSRRPHAAPAKATTAPLPPRADARATCKKAQGHTAASLAASSG